MGIFDKAKDLVGQADKAKELLEEHGDKLPGDLGEKAEAAVDAVDGIADKIPGV
jgi:hypothetical protein